MKFTNSSTKFLFLVLVTILISSLTISFVNSQEAATVAADVVLVHDGFVLAAVALCLAGFVLDFVLALLVVVVVASALVEAFVVSVLPAVLFVDVAAVAAFFAVPDASFADPAVFVVPAVLVVPVVLAALAVPVVGPDVGPGVAVSVMKTVPC